jgi:hypothetical protein
VPILSGNAIRHRAIREPGMMWLIEEYELRGKLNVAQLNFLLHGGNLTESTANENTRRIADMHRTWPLLRLLGGSLPNQILAGSLDVWRGILVCEENRPFLPVNGSPLKNAAEWLDGFQYTRGDAAKSGIPVTESALDAPTNLMIMSGQAVVRGARFFHGFILKHVSEIELGAMLWSLRLWQHAGGTIGGQAAKGHGRLRCELLSIDGVDQEAACAAYRDYAQSVKNDAIAWLNSCWGK